MSGLLGNTTQFNLSYQTQLSQLGVLFLDVLLREDVTLPSEPTRYPIEDGSGDISDHITQNNEELSIQGSISHATSFGMVFESGSSRLIDAVDQMRRMHQDRQTITVTTGLGRYPDMAFTNLQISRAAGDKGGNWIDINASLRKIRKVALREAQLPPERAAPPNTAAGASGVQGRTGQTQSRVSRAEPAAITNPNDSFALTKARALDAKFGTSLVGPHML